MTCDVCNAASRHTQCRTCKSLVPAGDDPRWIAWAGLYASFMLSSRDPRMLGWGTAKRQNTMDWLQLRGYATSQGLTPSGADLAIQSSRT